MGTYTRLNFSYFFHNKEIIFVQVVSCLALVAVLVMSSIALYRTENMSKKGPYDEPLNWKQLPNAGDIPIGSAGASMAIVDDYVIVFGGAQECAAFQNVTTTTGNTTYWNITCTPNSFYNDIYMYDIRVSRPTYQTWIKPTITGVKPPARSFHRAVGDDKGHAMYIYGGTTYQTYTGFEFTLDADFWKFDTKTFTWTNLTALTPNPGKRVDPGFDIDENGNIYLIGGLVRLPSNTEAEVNCKNDVWVYSTKDGKWTELLPNTPLDSTVPPVRYQAKVNYNSKHRSIFIYGGDVLPDNTRPLYDLWQLNIDTLKYKLLDANTSIPLITGISGTWGDVFYMATGEMRYGMSVFIY